MAEQTIPNWLAKRAALTPDRIAVMSKTEKWSFAELDKRAHSTARRLGTLGIQAGDFVALLFQNGLHVPEMIHALHDIGAVIVPLNIRLSSRELVWQIKDSQASLLVYDDINASKAAQIMDDEPHLKMNSYTELQACAESVVSLEEAFSLDALHSVIYTSGTTGYPKGVMLTYGNHWWSAIGSALNLGLHENDRWLACVPLFHVSGLSILMRSVIYGITAVIHETFDAAAANHAIQAQGVTMMSVVSTMLEQMVADLGGNRYPDTFRCMLLGGGPAPQVLLEKCRDHRIPVFQSYGLTETASQIVTLAPEYSLEKLGSAGKPLFPAQMRIEQNGETAAAGEAGEILLRGPNVTNGYFKRKKATDETIRNGWFHSGDIGYLDDDGFLYVLDRRKDMIISGGENVYPAEIEAVLLAHPDVVDAGVTGVSDEHWGQVPIGFVQTKYQGQADILSLHTFCRQHLAKYKVPSQIHIVDHLPRNASKKLLRRKLLDLMPDNGSFNE